MRKILLCVSAVITLLGAAPVHADAVIEWNTKANELIAEARMGTPPAVRLMAILQTAVHDSVKAASARSGQFSPEAAVAAASRAVLARALPAQEFALNAAYHAAVASIPDGPAKSAGVELGERTAATVLAARAEDGASSPERYRPATSPGTYVPTQIPAVPQWPQRKPWIMATPDQFRPAPPPALNSAAWSREFTEVKAVGARASTSRTAEQTEIAKFWEFSLPSIYFNVVRSVASAPGRDLAQNSRLYAAVAQAMDDGLISVIDAKYHYNFWRPVTAIRNGDQDSNEATERDAGWVSLVDAPLHPEYPSAHSVLAAAVGTVLKADLGISAPPTLSTTSPTLKGVTRRWNSVDQFVQEVADSRIWAGIHYRFSTEVGLAMGRQIGQLAAKKHLAAPHH